MQSTGRGQSVTVTNDGATILKSLHIDNPAAKVLVGILGGSYFSMLWNNSGQHARVANSVDCTYYNAHRDVISIWPQVYFSIGRPKLYASMIFNSGIHLILTNYVKLG